MKKHLIGLFLFMSLILLFGQDDPLQKTKLKFNKYKSIEYTSTAFYPNPDTDEVTSIENLNIINNYNESNFDFFVKGSNYEEIFNDRIFEKINFEEKTLYRYESELNQDYAIRNSHLVQYGPIFLINHNWKYENEIQLNGIMHSHYSFIESIKNYEDNIIKVEFHIYISPSYLISQFLRKSYVNDKLGQTVTYKFSNYKFSKYDKEFPKSSIKNLSLKFFEKSEMNPLQPGIKAPDFDSKDIKNRKITHEIFQGKKTILLFSSLNCGLSLDLTNNIYKGKIQVPSDFQFINIFASDTKDRFQKYFKGAKPEFSIIVNYKELENKYHISGYPTMYLIDENGFIDKTFDDYEQISKFLRNTK